MFSFRFDAQEVATETLKNLLGVLAKPSDPSCASLGYFSVLRTPKRKVLEEELLRRFEMHLTP